MKFLITAALIIFMGTNSFPQNDSSLEMINSKIEQFKNEFAPDKRTAIFTIEVEKENKIIILSGETNLPEAKNKLINELENLTLKIKDAIDILPSAELEDEIFGVVNLSVANLRSEPKHSAELSTQALLGTPIKVYKKKGGWYLIQTPDDYLGWVDDDGIQLMNEKELQDWNSSKKIIFVNEYGFSFSEKDRSSQPVSDIVKGDILKVISSGEDFVEIEFPDKRKGYISGGQYMLYEDWLKEIQLTDQSILSTAKSFMGIPYLWGGTSIKGFDCSGFTKTVYFLNGIILPRDASQQVNTGELIDTKNGFDNLLPGDLLFFGSSGDENKKERITHVAIYIGDKEFIHSSGRVRINSLDSTKENFSEYRFRTFIRAKRLLNIKEINGVKPVTTLFLDMKAMKQKKEEI